MANTKIMIKAGTRDAALARRVKVQGDLFHPRVPEGAVYVGRRGPGLRASPYANPHRIGACPCGEQHDAAGAVAAYDRHLDAHPELVAAACQELAGQALACWCQPGAPCHVDVLIARMTAVTSSNTEQDGAGRRLARGEGAGMSDATGTTAAEVQDAITATAAVDAPAALPDEHQEAALRALAAVDGVAWDDATNRDMRRYAAYVSAVLSVLPPAACAARTASAGPGRPSWDEQLRAALAAAFPPDVVGAITRADAYGALSWKLHELATDRGVDAAAALAAIGNSDRRFAELDADNPAAFLASRVPES